MRARKAGTFLGEAFMYRLHPQTAKLVELIRVGRDRRGQDDPVELRLRHAAASCRSTGSIANDLAGGGILDVGGYPGLDGAADRRRGGRQAVPEPDKVAGTAHLGQSGVDEWASARAALSRTASSPKCPAAISLNQDNVLRILGTKGRIEVPDFWFAGGNREGGTGKIDIIRADGDARPSSVNGRPAGSIPSRPTPPARRSSPAGRNSPAPGMSWADSLGNLRVLDKWRAGGRARIRDREGRQRASTRSPAGTLRTGGTAIAKRAIPGLSQAGLGRGARLRGFPHLLVRRRSCSTPSSRPAAISSTPALSMAPATPRRCSASG